MTVVMRSRLMLVAAALVSLGSALTGCGASTGGAASCAGPFIDDQPPGGSFRAPPPTYAAGSSFTLHGHWFTSTCNDTGGHRPLRPLPAVHVEMFLPGGTVVPLGIGTPHGRDMGFAIHVAVPQHARSGMAMVRDDARYPHTFRFFVGAAPAA